MTSLVMIPPVNITQGKAFSQSYRIEDPTAPEADRVISLDDTTAEVTFSAKPFDEPFFRAPVAIEGDRLIVSITAEETDGFPAVPIIGGKPSAAMQIDILGPVPVLNQLWQSSAVIAGRFK